VRRRILAASIVAVAIAAAAVTGVLLIHPEPQGPPVLVAQPPQCPDVITVYLETDEEMRAASAKIGTDTRFTQYFTRTKAEGFENFRHVFADQPDLLAGARVEAIPASVEVVHVHSLDQATVVRDLRAEFPQADNVLDGCTLTGNRSPVPGG
jgi:hypothetical protein